MAIRLTGEVGRGGRAEDVTIVQLLLANIPGPDGKPFWPGRPDGRPGDALAAAVEAFQRQWVTVAVAGGSAEAGVVRPDSSTWRAIVARFAAVLGEPWALPGPPVVVYAGADPAAAAADTAARLRRGSSARERTIAHRLRLELAQAVEKVAGTAGIGLALERTALAGDRVALWFAPVGLAVLDDRGRPQAADGRPGTVPEALWREVGRLVAAQAAVEATGGGGFRPREGMESLRAPVDAGTLLAGFGPAAQAIRGDRRPVLAALALIERIDRLSPSAEDELLQLFDIVAAEDPDTARALRRHRDAASRAANRQPAAVGDGPSPFDQAVDRLLRTMARNFRSSQFAQLRALARDPLQRREAYGAFERLATDNAPWDIKREFPRWVRDPEDGVEYGSDVWGNIHFGYLGKAAGFLGTLELLNAAGINQYGKDKNADPEGGELVWMWVYEFFSTWDDPKDQAAIELGFALWDQCRFPVPRGVLVEALRRRKGELNTR